MSNYRECDSRDFCDQRSEELSQLQASLEKIYGVACDIGQQPSAALATIAGLCEKAGVTLRR